MRRTMLEGNTMGLFLVLVVFLSSLDSSLGMYFEQCMDQDGRIRAEGENWLAEGCRECVCLNGNVQCHRLAVECPPRPFSHCVEIPGPCCPEWDCTTSGPDCSVVRCPGPPEPHCQPIIYQGQCCPVGWDCHACPNLPCPGPPRPDCRPFYPPLACCPEWDCSQDCSVVFCPLPPQPNCQPLIRDGECCAYDFICGCVDHEGIPRSEGEVWQPSTDPCQFCSCDQGSVFCFVRDCPPPPARPCTHPPHPGQCCRDCDPSLTYYN